MLGYKKVIDASHWQTFDYDEVKKHVDGVIIRFGFGKDADRMCDKHYDGFKEIPCAGYQWFRPDQDVKAQIEMIKVKTAGKNIQMFFSDQEQQGGYNIPLSVYTPTRLSEAGRAHVEGLALHGFDMGVYTRATWVSQFCRPMLDWMTNYDMWLASYPYDRTVVRCSWEDLFGFWAPKTFSPYYTAEFLPQHRVAKGWQFSGDKFIVPGVFTNPPVVAPVPNKCDFNFISDALFAKFTKVVPPPVVVEPPPVVVPPPPLTIDERFAKVEARVESAYGEIDQLQQIARTKGWDV